MVLFILCGVVSIVFLMAVYGLAYSRYGAGGVCAVSLGLLLFPGLTVGSLTLVSQAVLTLFVAIACLSINAKPKTMVVSALIVAALSYAPGLWSAFESLKTRHELLAMYPLQSLADRLSYESQPHSVDKVTATKLNAEVESRLEEFENRTLHIRRNQQLRALHERTIDEFIVAQNFGVGRMVRMRVRKESIELPKTEPIPLPPRPYQPMTEPASEFEVPLAQAADELPRPLPQASLLSMHTNSLTDFLEPTRFGYVAKDKRVAGFESHRFVGMPELKSDWTSDAEQWQVARLELVSLLKHDVPHAYVSKNLPQMDELKNAPTRTLDEFESEALERLRQGEDLVADNGIHRVHMLGSIRASTDCLACHSAPRGTLLGAFSYELARRKPSPLPESIRKPIKPQA